MNIAVFGGSFDPPHVGHEEIIKEALKKLDIDTLFVVPTFLNPFKETFVAPAEKRFEWIEKLILPYPKVKTLKYEINQNHPVPTIQTIKYLKKTYDLDNIYLIIGADNLPTLHKWKEFELLEKLVHFVVASRDDKKIPKNLQILDIHVNISSTKLREKMYKLHYNAVLLKEYLPKSIADEVMTYYNRETMNERIENIIKILDDKKAENIQLFDMKDTDYFVNEVIIATTLGQKHGLALVDYLKKGLKADESYLEIEPSDDWSVVDLGDILIHIMTAEYRAKYNIEDFLSKRDEENINQKD
jgi:nicotinate-nucleotide adenylyltransferase